LFVPTLKLDVMGTLNVTICQDCLWTPRRVDSGATRSAEPADVVAVVVGSYVGSQGGRLSPTVGIPHPDAHRSGALQQCLTRYLLVPDPDLRTIGLVGTPSQDNVTTSLSRRHSLL
jgi:hypothetical protein